MLVALASSPGPAQEVIHDGFARYMRKSKYNELRNELQLPGTINVVISGGIDYLNEYYSDEVKKSIS